MRYIRIHSENLTGKLAARMDFRTSTQAKQFLFTPDVLFEKRHEAYQRSGQQFSTSISEENHLKYVNYYGEKLLENSRKLSFNRFQRYTALALMQRVYLSRTIWDIPPPLAIISCLFIVEKFKREPRTLDCIISLLGYGEDFREKFKPEERVAGIEIEVLIALDWKLKVHLPFHQVMRLAAGTDREDECTYRLFEVLKTDALLLFPPGVIAIAVASSVLGQDHVMGVLREESMPLPDDLSESVAAVQALPYFCATAEEVEECERIIAEELVIFAARKEQKKREEKVFSATSMLPP